MCVCMGLRYWREEGVWRGAGDDMGMKRGRLAWLEGDFRIVGLEADPCL